MNVTTDPYLEPSESTHAHKPYYFKFSFNNIFYVHLGFCEVSFHSGFPAKIFAWLSSISKGKGKR